MEAIRKEYADRYIDLPPETRRFIENLRPGEIKLLEDSINFMRSAQTMGRFGRWTLLLIIGAFVSAASFGDAVTKILGWFNRGGQ